MGLDLTLTRKRYINAEEVKKLLTKEAKARLDVDEGLFLEQTVAVWRKANAIYRYLVEAEGADYDDGTVYISRETLEKLLKICKKLKREVHLVKGKVCGGYRCVDGKEEKIIIDGLVADNPELCAELLPTQSGFFFGSTDYDDYYMAQIDYTIEQLEKAMGQPDGVLDEWILYPSW